MQEKSATSRLNEILNLKYVFGKDRPLALIWLLAKKKIPAFEWKRVIDGNPFTDDELRRMWDGSKHKLNPGVATGRVSGWIIVDADDPKAVQWVLDNLPPTPVRVKTRNGIHFYYRYPEELDRCGNRQDVFGSKRRWDHEAKEAGFDVDFTPPKDDPSAFAKEKKRVDAVRKKARAEVEMGPVIDVRGDGGQVVAAGAIHPSGFVYEPEGDWAAWEQAPVFNPGWFEGLRWQRPNGPVTLDNLQNIAREDRDAEKIAGTTGQEKTKRARAWAQATPGAVSGSGGQIQSFYVACSLVNGFSLAPQDAYELMIDWNAKCQPPWEAHDIARMCERAALYGGENDGYKLIDRPEYTVSRKMKRLYERVYDDGGEDLDYEPGPETEEPRQNPAVSEPEAVSVQKQTQKPAPVPKQGTTAPNPPAQGPNVLGRAPDTETAQTWTRLLANKGIDYAKVQTEPWTMKQLPGGMWRFKPDTNNMVLALRYSQGLSWSLYEDVFKAKAVINGEALEDWHYLHVKRDLDDLWGEDIPEHKVRNAVHYIASCDRREPVQDMLNDLPAWDGGDHIRDMLVNVLGAEDSDINRTMLRHWLTGAVARAMAPGCKMDCILILFGEQGAKKSQVLRVLAEGDERRSWFTDQHLHMKNKDSEAVVSTHWIVEWSESEHAKSHERVNEVKGFLSKQEDVYRPPYERNLKVRPRRCVFAGTSNDEELLHDATGSRRFYVIPTADKIDLQRMLAIREQVLAQALDLFTRHQAATPWSDEWLATKWWFEKEEDAERGRAMERFVSSSPWDADIDTWVLKAGEAAARAAARLGPFDVEDPGWRAWATDHAFMVGDVIDKAMEIGKDKRRKYHENIVKLRLQALGCSQWRPGGKTRLGDRVGRFWMPPLDNDGNVYDGDDDDF